MLIAYLLLLPATHLLLPALHGGVTVNTVIGALMAISTMPLISRSLGNLTGKAALLFCDERALLIREHPGRIHISLMSSLTRISRNGLGYTLHLEGGRTFHLRHADAHPWVRAILDTHHDRCDRATLQPPDSSCPPAD